MPLFLIEAGQGIIAQGDLLVATSVLQNCSFIAGFNSKTNKAGAFHYPSGCLDNDPKCKHAMTMWIMALDPDKVVQISSPHAPDSGKLTGWIWDNSGIVPKVIKSFDGVMRLLPVFKAGDRNKVRLPTEIDNPFEDHRGIKAYELKSGEYNENGGFELFGECQMNKHIFA
jgi:hypothetical protein